MGEMGTAGVRERGGARFYVGEPLAGQAWPVEGMRYHQIVQVWGILLPVETLYMKLLERAMFSLPYLVLLQDNSTTA